MMRATLDEDLDADRRAGRAGTGRPARAGRRPGARRGAPAGDAGGIQSLETRALELGPVGRGRSVGRTESDHAREAEARPRRSSRTA